MIETVIKVVVSMGLFLSTVYVILQAILIFIDEREERRNRDEMDKK